MVFWIVAFLSLAVACMAVNVTINGKEVNCAPNCACCKSGQSGCGTHPSNGAYYCFDGCVDRIFGHRCNQFCHGNCLTCEQAFGNQCYTCKDTFYEVNTNCNKSCSVGCNGSVCNDDGSCSPCIPNFEGNTCQKCIQGKYGTTCSMDCVHKNCHCTTSNGCDSCKTGFYGNSTFCQTRCSPGCQNGVCNVDGTCDCISTFHGSKCTECSAGYYGTNCDEMCSIGCDNKQCSKDGFCSCRANFKGIKCDSCADESYGENCDKLCGIGCASSSCDSNNGFCECDPKFTGDKCDQCKSGFYGNSCNIPCSNNCVGRNCSKDVGKCMFGCVDRYSGDNCTTPCDSTCATCLQNDKLYCLSCNNEYTGTTCQCPPNCNCASGSDICASCTVGYANPVQQCKCQTQYCSGDSCNKCIDQTYYAENDACCKCPDNCKGGVCKSGPECMFGCIDGFYGLDCSIRCSSFSASCSICNRSDGMCLDCTNGFYPHVNGSCISCKSNCKNKQCNSKTGDCTNGCEKMFWGSKCDMDCSLNCETCKQHSGMCDSCRNQTVHGGYCNESCSSSCKESKCDRGTGYCLKGCIGHLFGNLCQTNCPENCQKSGSDTSCTADGYCTFGCVDGYEGNDCSESRVCTGSSTTIAFEVLSGVLGILLICTAAGCFLWNRRGMKPKEQIPTIELDQREIDITYEQLQGQANEQTYINVDDNYTVLSNVHNT